MKNLLSLIVLLASLASALAQSNPRVGAVYAIGSNTNTENSYIDAQRVTGDLAASLTGTNWFASFSSNKVYLGQLSANVNLTLTNIPTSTNVDRTIYITAIGNGANQVRLLNTPVNSYGSTNWIVPNGVWSAEARWVLGQLYFQPYNRIPPTGGLLYQSSVYGFTNLAIGSGLALNGTTLSGPFRAYPSNLGSVVYTNSTADSTAFTFTLPGGTLGTNKQVEIFIGGWLFNNTGTLTLTNTLTYGGTVMQRFINGSTLSSQATARAYVWRIVLGAAGSANAQRATTSLWAISANGNALAGVGSSAFSFSGAFTSDAAGSAGIGAVDSSVDQTVTVSLGSSLSGTSSFILNNGYAKE